MIRRWKEDDSSYIDADCRCHGDMLRISSWADESFFSLTFWKYVGSHPYSLRNRIRAAFRVLRYGYGQEEIILEKEDLKELVQALQEELNGGD